MFPFSYCPRKGVIEEAPDFAEVAVDRNQGKV